MNALVPNPIGGTALDELVEALRDWRPTIEGDGTVRVRDVRQDSRRAGPGDLFVARQGTHADGAQFARDAVQGGAVAVMASREASLPPLGVPVVRVTDVRGSLGEAAEVVHGRPTAALDVVGITGTNGKTTCAWILQHALAGAGLPTARLGTLGYSFGDDVTEGSLTTPEADEVSRLAARARDAGARCFVMEASSHALAQARVDAVRFAVGAFTNLTRDHLDYHESIEDYGRAKERLLTELAPRVSVVNVADAFGSELASRARGRVLRVGRTDQADVFPLDVTSDALGIRGRISVLGREVTLESPLVGGHNLDNLLLVVGIALGLGLDPSAVADSVAQVGAVPGRLERCDSGEDDLVVLVDYAHTPDALGRALEAVRGLTKGRLICVFGCGGDRDPGKRARMGEAVGSGADRAIITSDNPRSEDPRAILDAITPAVVAAGIEHEVIEDRRAAIDHAIDSAAEGDVVLIAGKGHETYQIVGDTRHDFDDRVVAWGALARRRHRGKA